MIRTEQLGFRPLGSPQPVLEDVSLQVRPGERVGIIGPSGSGKTTLGLHLAGLHRVALLGRTSGRLWLEGCDCTRLGREAFAGVVLQNPEIQLFCETVEEELELSLQHRGGRFDRRGELARCLKLFGLEALRHQRIAALSLGWKQRLSVASMLALNPRVLLLDEPTSYLDEAAAEELFAVLELYSRHNQLTVLMIEHDLPRLLPWASRLLAVRQGRLVFDGAPQSYAAEPVFPTGAAGDKKPGGAPALYMERVCFAYRGPQAVLKDFSLTVARGEIVALLGPNGSGKSTLLNLAKGLLEPDRGRIWCAAGTRMEAVGFVFQNPDSQLFAHSVFEECSFLPRNQGLPPAKVSTQTRQALARVGLEVCSDRVPFTLSYGEKRRLTLASTLSGACPVLCLDEPTVGLDRDCVRQLAGILRQESARGVAVLLATHDADFAGAVASRVVCLKGGGEPRTGGRL